MNKQIRHVSVAALILLAVLVVSTTYWQTWAVGDLAARKDNETQLIQRLTIDRGKILAADGTVLAENRKTHRHGLTLFNRVYPQKDLAPQVLGYATNVGTTTGLEQTLDDYLTGANTNLTNTFKQELDRLGGQTVRGDNVYLTLRPGIQRLAQDQLAGRCGAVVVLDTKTGAVVAMASSPTYNANLMVQPNGYNKVKKIKGTCGDASALQNNATAGLYPPGSTFKMVTAAAALDSGAYSPSSPFYDPGYCVEYGQHVSNAGNPDQSGPEAFGNVSLAQGFEHSINSVFCNVGKHIGGLKILDYAKRFGFYSIPPLDTPPATSLPSGLYKKGRLWRPTSNTQIDSGRLAFGQFNMLATPLQMALVGATIANKGVLPRPYLVKKVVAADGSTVTKTVPQTLGRVLKPQTAAELNQMMQLVVQGGTAATVGFPSSLKVAGKTGTAELGLGTIYDSWFVAFAPADNPRYVVAVVVAKQPNGFGASVAAPIAKAILEKLLAR
ncbi:MAG TPA: penicillin-binding transpeptidase domain-containing protein [Gaiellaceae bacterium]|nr:penicillin-binding transpeptidase domain-containing protein [Gaiellaceae bacterium]